MARGLFVTFEGPEGGGKSTQVKLLSQALTQREVPHVTTREPGGTPTAMQLRAILLDRERVDLGPEAELLLMMAARADHVGKVIAPNLEKGTLVVCDRFTDSSVAYQGGGRGLDVDLIEKLNRFATAGYLPDLTLLLDIDVEVGLQRAGRQGALQLDRIESGGTAFHQRVRDAYLGMARRSPKRFRVVDGTRPIGDVARDVLNAVLERKEGPR